MASLNEISAPVAPALEEFNRRFRQSIKTDTPLLDRIIRYILKRKGKQMRPMFVFLSAGLFGPIGDNAYHAASLIELLHTASLVHDDVVDESDERRGMFSVNALWKNKAAVLVGDYLLSKGLLISITNQEFEMLRIVSEAVKEMSEGELLQIEKARFMNITEEVYFNIIRKKTASLIAACCACGARAAGIPQEDVDRMHQFGLKVGIAFQIKDDLFDFTAGNKTGKPGGIDLRDKKISLPLIHLLNQCGLIEKRQILGEIKKHSDDAARMQRIIEKVRSGEGLNYATERMMQYRSEALQILHHFPENPFRKSLEQLVIFTTERDH